MNTIETNLFIYFFRSLWPDLTSRGGLQRLPEIYVAREAPL